MAHVRIAVFVFLSLLLPTAGGYPEELPSTSAPRPPARQAAEKKLLRLEPPAPVQPDVREASMRRGVAYLLKNQNKDGSWGGPSWKGGVRDLASEIPGSFRSYTAAVTALCVEALIESGGNTPEVQDAIKRGEAWLLEHLREVRQDGPGILYNIWAHAYGIQALAAMHGRLPDDQERRRTIEKLIHEQVNRLKRYETVAGGWYYYGGSGQPGGRPWTGPSSFVNATVLVALDRAKRLGIDLPQRVVDRAIKSTVIQRKPDGSYVYSATKNGNPQPEMVMWEINQLPGSVGRVQACNAALRLWGDEHISDDVLKVWLDRLIARNGWLDLGRKKPMPHESFAMVAAYFYYYGHYYAGLCIGQLPARERPFYQDHLARIIIERQEEDGSWFDWPIWNYHKPYGTAFALMTLQACRKQGIDK